jgi:hypothetical protein
MEREGTAASKLTTDKKNSHSEAMMPGGDELNIDGRTESTVPFIVQG